MDWHNDQQRLSPDELAAIYNGGYGDSYQRQYAPAPACSAEAEGPNPVFIPSASQVDDAECPKAVYDEAARMAYKCGMYRLMIEYADHCDEVAGYEAIPELKAAFEALERGKFDRELVMAGARSWLDARPSDDALGRKLDRIAGM